MTPFAESTSENGTPLATSRDDVGADDSFGLVDVIEAFTAMRHEFRGSIRESRDLTQSLQQANSQIVALEPKLLAAASSADGVRFEAMSRRLVESLIEIDVNLTRGINTSDRLNDRDDSIRQLRSAFDEMKSAASSCEKSRGRFARWFGKTQREVYAKSFEQLQISIDKVTNDSTFEGLKLLVSRVRRLIADREIERIETVGLPFDGEQMHAIDTVLTDQVPSGHVAEQMAAAYRWRGQVIRFAEVRVAKSPIVQ